MSKTKIKEDKIKKIDKNTNKNKSLVGAMRYALNGIIHAFKTERNLRIDYIIGTLVLLCSLFFDFSKTEMICLILTIGFVIFSEMINTTVEYIVDLITDEYNENAKAAKDIAAGGVFISGGISVIVAYFLFVDKLSKASTSMLTSILSSRAHLLVTVLFVAVLLTVVIKGIACKKRENYVEAFPSTRVTVSFALAIYLYIITKSFLVGGIALVLALIISSLKKEKDNVSYLHLIFSALLGILIVLTIYHISLVEPWMSGLF